MQTTFVDEPSDLLPLQGSPVGSVEDEGTGLLETAKLNSEGGKPAPVCKELDVWRPENSYVVIDVAIDSLQADDSEPKKAPLKGRSAG